MKEYTAPPSGSDVPPPVLVAMGAGMPPYMEPLCCEDLRGPRSLFGENLRLVRPLRKWGEGTSLPPQVRQEYCYDRAQLLWEEGAPEERESLRCALPKEDGRELPFPELSVPAPTYLGGVCTSTFDAAWKLTGDGLFPAWSAILASRQTQGRGQLRRAWHSPAGNLHVTFRLPEDPLFSGDTASLIIGYLMVRAFSRLGYELFLKWPNDLLTRDGKKAGGILLEERGGILLAGFGINLAEPPSASDMRKEGSVQAGVLLNDGPDDDTLAPFPLWRSLVDAAIVEYTDSLAGKRLSSICASMESVLAWKGRQVTLVEGNGQSLSGLYAGIGPGGGLLLAETGGDCRELFSGSLFLGASP